MARREDSHSPRSSSKLKASEMHFLSTWVTTDRIDSSALANDSLLLPGASSNPRYRVEFDSSEATGRARIPLGDGESGFSHALEPVTRDIPDDFIDQGTGLLGGTKQIYVEGSVSVRRVTDLSTGQIVWER